MNIFAPIFDNFESFVTKIKSSKSLQEEAKIAKTEIAYIKETINSDDCEYHNISILKVIYLHMLGYNVDFSQLRCIKLMSSCDFQDKKVGYMACAMLIDESSERHELVAHTINSDISSKDPFVQGMALSAFASIVSHKLASESIQSVLKALSSSHPFIQAKAAICASKIVERIPHTCEVFTPYLLEKLKLKDHAVRISCCSLGINIVKYGVDHLGEFWIEMSRVLISILREKYDSSKMSVMLAIRTLHVRVMRLLSVLQEVKGVMIPDFEEILTNYIGVNLPKEHQGNSKVYSSIAVPIEAINILTKMKIPPDVVLIVKSSLSSLLEFKSANIRLVSLKAYRNFMSVYPEHCDFELLKDFFVDSEIYPVKLALESIFFGLKAKADKEIIIMLIEMLEEFDLNIRDFVIHNLVSSIFGFPSAYQEWKLDSILKVLAVAGKFEVDDNFPKCIELVMSSNDSLKSKFIHLSFFTAIKCPANEFINQLVCWLIGEIGDKLMVPCVLVNGSTAVSPQTVLDFLQHTLATSSSSRCTKYLTLTSLVKVLIHSPQLKEPIWNILVNYTKHVDAELQSRSLEYLELIQTFGSDLSKVFPPYTPPANLFTKSESFASTEENMPINFFSTLDNIGSGDNNGFLNAIFGDPALSSSQPTFVQNFDSRPKIINDSSILLADFKDAEFYMTPYKPTSFSVSTLIFILKCKTPGSQIRNSQLRIAPAKSISISISKMPLDTFSDPDIVLLDKCDVTMDASSSLKMKLKLNFEDSADTPQEFIKLVTFTPEMIKYTEKQL